MNVPKLRFKEFSNDWKDEKLEDVVDFLDDRRKPIKDSDRNNIKGIYPYYGASGIIDYINDYIFDEELLLLGEDGANILSRSTQLVFKATGKYWVNNHAHVLRPKENYNIDFLESCLENINYEPYNTGTAQPKLNQEVCRKINIKTPSLKEQVKIGETLSLLDKKIELQTKKIEVLKLFKKGLNQRMFSKIGELKSISQYVEEYINKTSVNNQYPILSSTFNGIVIQNEYFNKQAASSKNIGYKIVPRNYITYRSMSDTGEFHFNIQDKVDIGIVSPAYPVFRINNINVNYFLNYINESYDFKMQIISIKEGGTRYALGFNKFKKLKIKIIDDDEFYGDFIKKLNEYLLLEGKKLDDLNKLKKGFLQNMFI